MRRLLPAVAALALAAVTQPSQASPGDPLRSRQWGYDAIHAGQARALASGKGVTVAVIGTGIDAHHPDLRGAVLKGRNVLHPGASTDDLYGVGTAVAGVVGARAGNGEGIAGIAPQVRLLPVVVAETSGTRFSPSPFADETQPGPLAEGIVWARDHGARVIVLADADWSSDDVMIAANASAGLLEALRDVTSRGAVVVLPSGDSPTPGCAGAGATEALPVGVLCVGSVDKRLVHDPYSRLDTTAPSAFLVAPGGAPAVYVADDYLPYAGVQADEGVLSTAAYDGAYNTFGDRYAQWAGSPMAAAHVAGVAALLSSRGLTNKQVVARILATTTDLGAPGRDPVYGYGLVDADAAVRGR